MAEFSRFCVSSGNIRFSELKSRKESRCRSTRFDREVYSQSLPLASGAYQATKLGRDDSVDLPRDATKIWRRFTIMVEFADRQLLARQRSTLVCSEKASIG